METITKLAPALIKAQAQIEGATKDSMNPHFRNKYADLASVTDAIKKPLNDNGLAYTQRIHPMDGGVGVETIIIHTSGETLSNGITFVPAPKNDPHGYGSALTYARRYSLSSCFGVIQEDDDANGAVAIRTTGDINKEKSKRESAPKFSNVTELKPFTESEYKKLVEHYPNDITLPTKIEKVYRISKEFKERFTKEMGYVWG
jgi:hypothetical protein